MNTFGLLLPQIPHAERILASLTKHNLAIDLSETGTGKTYSAAAVIREVKAPTFVICPKSVIPQWEKVLKSFGVAATLINYELIGRGNTKFMKWKKTQDLLRPWVETATREMPVFNFPAGSLVIFDEGHRCKGNDTSNAWMLVAAGNQGYKVLVISATIATTPLEMFAVGFLTQLHRLYNFADFCRVHGAKYLGRWGAMSFDSSSKEAAKSMLALREYLFQTAGYASRLTTDDLGALFPDTHVVAEAYSLGANEPKIQAVYEEMERELEKLEEHCEGYSEHIFAIITKARRQSEMLKVPLFVEMIEDLYAEGKSVAVFVNFTETVAAITKRLNKGKKHSGEIGYVVGGQSEKQRQDDIDGFNADRKRIIVCNIAAGGVGINLHDLNGKFPRASIISPNYSAVQLIQALGRIHRQGGLTKSYQRVVFAAKTIEEVACQRVQFRINNLSALNDADMTAGIQLF